MYGDFHVHVDVCMNLQEDELDDDAFKFQVTVAHINVAEDRVLDDNQALIEVR